MFMKAKNIETIDGIKGEWRTVTMTNPANYYRTNKDGKPEHFFPLPAKRKRKVAKVTVSQKYASSLIQICGVINGVKFYNHYKSRKSALRGAQRFCKAIGWEMEVVK